jgi:hypothetical protein
VIRAETKELSMNHEVHLREEYGARLSDGTEAYRFRVSKIDPYLAICEQVVLDFTGVRSANSSFVNALVSGLFEHLNKTSTWVVRRYGVNVGTEKVKH